MAVVYDGWLSYKLIENGAATGTAVKVEAGRYLFGVPDGTFSNATVALQWRPESGRTMRTIDALAALTTHGYVGVWLPAGEVQATVTGGPPSGVYAYLMRLPA